MSELTMCCKVEPLWLDCDCGEPEDVHQFPVCPECGASHE